MLRHPSVVSPLRDLAEGRFARVLGDTEVRPERTNLVLLCTGKIYYDLVAERTRRGRDDVAILRLEQLYPLTWAMLRTHLLPFAEGTPVRWVQEEPRNMGARAHMSPRLLQILPEHLEFGYVGRPERAAPGEGYPAAHNAEQNRILSTALDLGVPVSAYPKKTPGER
jgi:2-oxoglutarate dehydrogenase E1 component